MFPWPALAGIVAALSVGVVSPGPSFVVVARTAMVASRSDGLGVALGMGVGGLLFAVAALLGLRTLLLALPTVYLALKLAGGVYLAWLGWRIWTSAKQTLVIPAGMFQVTSRAAWRKSFMLGLGTHLGNPKTAVVYASVFAAFLPATQTAAFDIALVACVVAIECGWYAAVALLLAAERPRRAYLRYKRHLDRVAGGVMMALGLRLAWSAFRS
ncbi:MAG TPA: LysE family translocator [Caldimonas sp.]|nr:LysE family translocator [Caldimonas sp.]